MSNKDLITQILSKIKPTISFDSAEGIIDDGLLDSLEFIYLISELNGQFGVEIDVDDIVPENFNTVEAIASLVRRLRGESEK